MSSITNETLRSQIRTSIHGRRLGLDDYGCLVGPLDIRVNVEEIATTAATSFTPTGLTVLTTAIISTGPTSNTLQAPIPGTFKTLFLNSTSTGANTVTFTSASLYLTSMTSAASVTLVGEGACLNLFARSTSQWILANGSTILPSNVTAA